MSPRSQANTMSSSTRVQRADGDQLSLAAFGTCNLVKLDGGERIRLDDLVDFWPATGVWQMLETGEKREGLTAMLGYLTHVRLKAGTYVDKALAIPTQRRVWCNYCRRPAELYSGRAVYPDREDLFQRQFWVCWPCQAWTGCRQEGDLSAPLGPLANEDLRQARYEAHKAFEPLWKTGGMTREQAYTWLAGALQMDPQLCRINALSVAECRQAVELAKAEMTRIEQTDP
jgi:hypothetical protein